MKEDKNFDNLVDRLKSRVYGSPKGRLRVDLICQDLEQTVPEIDGKRRMKILDAGGGLGQIGLFLARKGHDIVLCDISQQMIDEAVRLFTEEGLEYRLTAVHSPFQALPQSWFGTFDLVMSHAVLEWLGEPKPSLERLFEYMKPSGTLSLMFYNKHSLVQKNALKGKIVRAMKEHYTVGEMGLTPQHPLDPEDVAAVLRDRGLDIVRKTGIRVFYDYMTAEARLGLDYESLLSLETRFCRDEPFASLGRYVHYIAARIG
jgi:S-adenosylmethionine-dependent methyltransferase